jgi:hypothetical protein
MSEMTRKFRIHTLSRDESSPRGITNGMPVSSNVQLISSLHGRTYPAAALPFAQCSTNRTQPAAKPDS